MLTNLKYIIDHDLVLLEDFYTVENMKKFIGSEENPFIRKNTGINVSIRGHHFGYLANIAPTDQAGLSNCQFSVALKQTDKGKMSGIIHLICINEVGPKFVEVEAVFGKNWKKEKLYQSPHACKPLPRRGISYHFDDASIKRTVQIAFKRVHEPEDRVFTLSSLYTVLEIL